MIKDKVNSLVLEFYRALPFNVYGNEDIAIKNIKSNDIISYYKPLKKIFENNNIKNILDVGCGGGWFINSLAYKFKNRFKLLGIDFNEIAIKHARKISLKLNLTSKFEVQNLFELNLNQHFDFISSLGVLHHTHDCIGGINSICKFGEKKSFLLIGLYHRFGRKPFLDYIDDMKNMTEEEKFRKYKKLHKLEDEKHLISWFNDQVLHPHETQHTYEEIYPVIEKNNYKVLSTSINNFKSFNDHMDIIQQEKKLYNYGLSKIKNEQYYPGFFIILAQKN